MAKTLNLEDLIAKQGGAADANGKTPVGDLLAEILTCTIKTPDGTVVLQAEMIPRVFTAKEDKKGNLSSAAGFQLVGPWSEEDPEKRDRLQGNYRGLPLRPNCMLFVPTRAKVGQDIDLRTADEKAVGAFESDES